MPENYIALFSAPDKQEAKAIVENAKPAIRSIIDCFRNGMKFPAPRNNLYDRFMSSAVNPIFYKKIVKADAFTVSDACIGCEKCVQLCPLNNIRLDKDKPVWGSNCTHCMACICYCPKEAIEYGKRSVGKPRYHFEALGFLHLDSAFGKAGKQLFLKMLIQRIDGLVLIKEKQGVLHYSIHYARSPTQISICKTGSHLNQTMFSAMPKASK